jgi:hypothetical protein
VCLPLFGDSKGSAAAAHEMRRFGGRKLRNIAWPYKSCKVLSARAERARTPWQARVRWDAERWATGGLLERLEQSGCRLGRRLAQERDAAAAGHELRVAIAV